MKYQIDLKDFNCYIRCNERPPLLSSKLRGLTEYVESLFTRI